MLCPGLLSISSSAEKIARVEPMMDFHNTWYYLGGWPGRLSGTSTAQITQIAAARY